jgi:hypothetical protein
MTNTYHEGQPAKATHKRSPIATAYHRAIIVSAVILSVAISAGLASPLWLAAIFLILWNKHRRGEGWSSTLPSLAGKAKIGRTTIPLAIVCVGIISAIIVLAAVVSLALPSWLSIFLLLTGHDLIIPAACVLTGVLIVALAIVIWLAIRRRHAQGRRLPLAGMAALAFAASAFVTYVALI